MNLDSIRERHLPVTDRLKEPFCNPCCQAWPCDAAILLEAVDHAEALYEMVTDGFSRHDDCDEDGCITVRAYEAWRKEHE